MNFDWHTILGTVASILLVALVVPYIRSILKSTTRPSAVSALGWTTLFALATAAQASKGVEWSLALPLISTLSSGAIAFTALRMRRVVWTRADIACVSLATLAVILWVITQEPLTAIVLSIIADFFVTLPTIIKTYHEPSSEPARLWVLYVLGGILVVVATASYTLYNLLFPIYTVLGSAVITILALRKSK